MTSARTLAAAVATQILACQPAGPRGPRPARPVMTLRAHRLPAVRLCLLFLAAVLSSAIVLALAASVDPSGAAAASRPATGLSAPVLRSVSKRNASRRKPAATRRAACAAARTEKARKACAVAKAKAKAKNPSVSAGPFAPSLLPALTSPGVQEPVQEQVDGEASPAGAPEPIAPEGSGSAPKLPGGSGVPPVETPPVETPPIETPPVETPPVETPPIETPPFETPPVETPPIETAPLETPPAETPPVETPPVGPPVETPPVETPSLGQSSTMTTLVSSANPSTVGQSITYTATISALAATGTVEFKDGGVVISGCSDRAVSFGIATCTVGSYATTGSHSVTATYSGDGNYLSSTSSTLTQTILSAGQGTGQAVSKKATSMTTLSSSSDPSTVGEVVIYTALVGPADATGTVEFKQSGVAIVGCSAQPVSSGTATCTVPNLAAGGYWVMASYSGDSNYAMSSSPGLTQTVKKKVTTTAVSSSLDPSTVGEAVTFTATVSPAAATGTVEFKQSGVAISGCSAQAVSSGIATCTVPSLAAGGGVMASYSGDSNYAMSSSPGLTQTVKKKVTTTAVSSSLDPSTVGEAVTFTATVSPAAATGTVEFKQSGVAISGCSAQAVSSGIATCTVPSLAAGGGVMASYSGDSNYAMSSSPGLTQTVKKKVTTTAVSSSLDPSTVGEAVTFTATVSPAAATGTGEFKQSGVAISGCSAQAVSSVSRRVL